VVVFDVTLSAANWYILHKFSGSLWGNYPFLIGIDIFPQCLPTEFHLHYFPVEALFRFLTSGTLLVIVVYLIWLGSFKMEPHKRAKYSKSLDPDEIEEY
jgi:uncharacterized membrane protein